MIYLDYNATTPIRPEVREAMMPYLTGEWGNPSSTFGFGARMRKVVETAREQVSVGPGNTAREIEATVAAVSRSIAALKS